MYRTRSPTGGSDRAAAIVNQAAGARRLLRRCRNAGLATHSHRMQGFPYASVVPLMLDHEASPIMLLSRLAEHTKNIEADERVSMVAHAPGDDVQAAPRLTLLGSCRRTGDGRRLAERYVRYFPGAAQLLELDFDFYRVTVTALRYIGGFGSAHWLDAESIRPPSDALVDLESSMLEYANTMHAQDLRDCCRRVHATQARAVRMIGLDCDGFDARADSQLLRFEFAESAHDPESVRSALAALIREGRA